MKKQAAWQVREVGLKPGLSHLKKEEAMAATAEPISALNILCILDSSGDSRIQWNQSNPEEVAKAQLRFDELRKQGYLAYKVNKKGDKGEVIDVFDPSAERILLHSAMIGG